MTRILTGLLPLALSGCWLSAAEIDAKIESIDQGDIQIRSLSPALGSAAGGTRVFIQAPGVEEGVKVYFGDDSATVIGIESSGVWVQTPALGAEGPVDVVLEAQTGSATAEGAFYAMPDGSGQTGALGEIAYVDYIGSYWPASTSDHVLASLSLIEPASFDYSTFYGSALDRCESDYDFDPNLERYAPGASAISLRAANGVTVDLAASGSGEYGAELDASEYATEVTWSLEAIDGSDMWAGYSVEDIAETPGIFTVTSPRLDSSEQPVIEETIDLEWTKPGDGDYVAVRLIRYQGNSVAEEVRCLLEDDGSHRVSGSTWEGWSSGSDITVMVGRVVEAGAELPHNGSTSAVAGVYWVVGQGIAR